MRTKIRIFGFFVAFCMLVVSAMGCGTIPAGNIGATPDVSPEQHADSPAATEKPQTTPIPTPTPISPNVEWRPLVVESLDDMSLDTWLSIQPNVYPWPRDMRTIVMESMTDISPELADAMAWRYICALRQYIENDLYPMIQDEYVDLSHAYRDDGTLDASVLNGPIRDIWDRIEGTEIVWDKSLSVSPRISYGCILEWIHPCSRTFRDYIALLALDDDPLAKHDEANFSYVELADRTLAWEALIDRAQGTPFLSDVEDQYLRYLNLLLGDCDDSFLFGTQIYSQNKITRISAEAEAVFEYVLDTRPGSATAAAVTDWWSCLRDFVDSEASPYDAYEQLLYGFSERLSVYASVAGVRIPRVSLKKRIESSETNNMNYHMQYPILYGDGVESDAMLRARDWISTDIYAFWEEMNVAARLAHTQYFIWPYEACSTLRLPRPAGAVISIVVDLYGYRGGAHGANFRCGYNFDPVTGDKVELPDLFKPDVDAWSLVGEAVTRYIELNQDRFEATGSGVPYSFFDAFPEDTEWYANDEGIVVIFQEYEVDCYAAGAQEITVPWWRLADYLK